ncbi:MAG TPA: M23 family metallopeptidase [Nocardioides sp.]|uniref:M23 family metallopeptidase n=1 Tax=Nocardioides sp. TaxID=35761 RepID=UPI002E366874|nr:M23 family metallopeptidase [Nocardioides sp.]HEX5088852.1 M23 family metallopeptidase [Nocardioides sp.]
MRSFPGAGGRSVLACLLVVTLGGAAVPALAADGDGLKHKQKHVHQQIQQVQGDIDEASRAITRAKAQLAEAEKQLAAAQADYAAKQAYAADVQAKLQVATAENDQAQAALQAAQATLAQAKADVVAGQAALDAQQKKVKDTIVGLYQQGSPQLMAWTGYLEAQTPDDLIRKMEYADTLVEDQNSVFVQLHAAEVALRAKKEEVKVAEAAADEQADVAAQELNNVTQLKQEADQAVNEALLAQNQVTLTVAARQKAQHKAQRAKKRDREELRQLQRQEQHIKHLIALAAAHDHSPGFVGNDDGFLLPPVNGPVTSPFGYRIHPIYHYWGLHDGTDFGVSCGEGMRAAADGRVLSRYWSDVYGNRLYIDVGKVNGHNLTVVYNHASSYRVNVGDHVTRGEIVGYVGSTGWSTGCHLHFTVLRDGKAVDPMTYL